MLEVSSETFVNCDIYFLLDSSVIIFSFITNHTNHTRPSSTPTK